MHPKHLTIGIVCSVLLASPAAIAGEKMSREPKPGEMIEKTKLSDEEIKRLLVGGWLHEHEISDIYTIKQTYTFQKDGSYEMNRVSRIHFPKEKTESSVKGQWTVRDGILTLTPICSPTGRAAA